MTSDEKIRLNEILRAIKTDKRTGKTISSFEVRSENVINELNDLGFECKISRFYISGDRMVNGLVTIKY